MSFVLVYRKVKEQEVKRRMAATKQARKSSRSATALQERASLVGSGKWRITNLRHVAKAMAKWA